MLVTYWLPLVILAVAYFITGRRLQSLNVGNENQTQIKKKEKNKKVHRDCSGWRCGKCGEINF